MQVRNRIRKAFLRLEVIPWTRFLEKSVKESVTVYGIRRQVITLTSYRYFPNQEQLDPRHILFIKSTLITASHNHLGYSGGFFFYLCS